MNPFVSVPQLGLSQAFRAARIAAISVFKRIAMAMLLILALAILQGCANSSAPPVTKVVEVAQPVQKIYIKVTPNRGLLTCDDIVLPSQQDYLKTAVPAKKAVEEERDRLWNLLADEFRRAARCRASINAEVKRMEDELLRLEQEHAR